MKTTAIAPQNRLLLLLLAVVASSLFVSGMVNRIELTLTLAVTAGGVICITSFLRPDIALYILILSMLLSPEFGSRTTTGEGVTLRVDDFLLVIIGASWLARTALDKNIGLVVKTRLNTPIFIYLAVCIISTGFGILLGNVQIVKGFFFVLKYFEYYVVYFMVINHVKNAPQLRRLLLAMLFTCFVVNLVGLAQISGGDRVTAPFEGEEGEPNTLGGYLVIMMAITMALAVSISSKGWRMLLWALTGLSFVTLLFTQSRSSYLSFFVMYGTLFVVSRKMIFMAIAALGIAIAPLALPDVVVERISYTFNQYTQPGQKQIGSLKIDTSTSARLQSWEDSFKGFLRRPVLGYGVTGWKEFLDAQYMLILIETGVIGAFCFIMLVWSLFYEALRSLREASVGFHRGICMGFIAALAGILVHALSANTFIIVRVMEPFWCLAGIVVMINIFDNPNRLKKDTPAAPPSQFLFPPSIGLRSRMHG